MCIRDSAITLPLESTFTIFESLEVHTNTLSVTSFGVIVATNIELSPVCNDKDVLSI